MQKTITSFLDSYYHFSSNTTLTYDSILSKFAYIAARDHPKDITTEDIRRYFSFLTSKKLAMTTIALRHSCLKAFFKFCLKNDIIASNPMEKIDAPKRGKRLPEVLSEKEINSLLALPDIKTKKGCRDQAIIELFYASGIRLSELTALNAGHINFELKRIQVMGKGQKERLVPLHNAVLKSLRRHLKVNPTIKHLFKSQGGGGLTPRAVQLMLKKYLRQLGIEHKTVHSIRHSFGTHLLDHGADIRHVQELMGHSDIGTTQKYTHVSQQKITDVYRNCHPKANKRM